MGLDAEPLAALGFVVMADRLIAADKDFELLIVPGAEHKFIDHHVRKRCWDFLVRELMGADTRLPPSPHRHGPEVAEMFA